MKSYKSLTDSVYETVISRSRFISFLYQIEGEDDAKERLAALRKKYYDATHVCYAYIADEEGNLCKSSDDGEPSSTAGAPIMSVIGGYRKVLLAAVRYFGGTKLGVGGLIKAYTDSAINVIACSIAEEYFESNIYLALFSYPEYERCKRILSNCKLLKADYTDKISCELAAKTDCLLINQIKELFGYVPEISLIKENTYIKF